MTMGLLFGVLALIGGAREREWEEEPTYEEPLLMGPGLVGLGPGDLLPEPEYIETAQGTTILSPYQPRYEEQLLDIHPKKYAKIKREYVRGREEAGILDPHYDAPYMPREARGRR